MEFNLKRECFIQLSELLTERKACPHFLKKEMLNGKMNEQLRKQKLEMINYIALL